MMAWWHRAKPGDKVVCVAEPTRVHAKLRALSLTSYAPMKGHVYTIKTINHWPSDSLLTLHELDNSHLIEPLGATMEPGISVAFFRPVQRRSADLSIFTDMLRSDERAREASDKVSA